MKLKEIEMDLPYKENSEYIRSILDRESINYEEAMRRDYEVNWKGLRRKFQLMTRCMTSMIERIMRPTITSDCWKIIFECVDEPTDNDYKNLLGVYVVQIPFNITDFFMLTDYDKKRIIIDKILEGIDKLSKQVEFEVSNIEEACRQISDRNYSNDWIWKKKLKINDRIVQIKIKHEVSDASINMIFSSKENTILREIKLIETTPDERVYDMYLGKLEKISEKEVALVTKTGEKLIQSCNM